MKFIKLFPFLLFFITVTIVSCNKDDTDEIISSRLDTIQASWDTLVASSFISEKNWQAIRINSFAYMVGPQTDDWDWNSSAAPYFTWGADSTSDVLLSERLSLANDTYRFNDNNSFRITFYGDFYGNELIWEGTPYESTDINIESDILPTDKNGNDVNAYISNQWRYEIDDRLKQLTILGTGAHIIDPIIKNTMISIAPEDQITYEIVYMAEGDFADTLVLSIDTYDHYNNQDIRVYYQLAHYRFDIPNIYTPHRLFVESQYHENSSYDTLGDLIAGQNTVFSYYKSVDEIEIITDDEYSDLVLFEIEQGLEEFLITGEALKNANPILNRFCFCSYFKYEIHEGYIKGNLNTDNSYTIEFSLTFKSSDYTQAYHLYDKRIFQPAP